MTLRKRYYRKYANGSTLLQDEEEQKQSFLKNPGLAQGLAILGSGIDMFDTGNQYGRQKTATTTLKGALSGASIGTSIAPGIGTVAGALLGGAAGFLGGKKAKKAEEAALFNQKLQEQQNQLNRSAAILSTDPALVTGRPGAELYANGGTLKNRYYNAVQAVGGSLKPLSQNAAEVQGPTHEQGGVDLPQYQSEVEGNETLQGDYVFSDRLGFASRHKKLATAIGKIEQKPATPDRINSLKRLYGQIDRLKVQQEQIRSQYNLQ